MLHSHDHLGTCARILAIVAASALGLASCGGPTGPQQGTPEWYWQAAVDNFAIPDYGKTVEQLDEAAKAGGPLGDRALLWRTVLNGGLALGYDELSDAYSEGIEANEARTDEFTNFVSDYRRRTRVNAIEFSESLGKLAAMIDAQETLALDFPLPQGNGSVSPLLTSVREGNKVEAQATAMEDQTLTRGIYSLLAELNGGSEISAVMDEAAGAGLQVTKAEAQFAIARLLLDISIMFDREGINDPKVRSIVLEMAVKWGEPHYEHEAFAERVEEFKFDLENERRDMEGKRRMKKKED